MARKRNQAKQSSARLPDQPFTENQLALQKAANRVSITNTDTRGDMIAVLSDCGFQVIARGDDTLPPYIPQRQTATFLGSGRYQVGAAAVICLTGRQANVLQALVESPGATLDDLRRRSGESNPSAVLKTICKNHPSLALFIILPGGKCKGGYSTTIVDGENK